MVFLTTDVHATLINDARFKTLESGGPENSGITRHDGGARGHGELRHRDRRDDRPPNSHQLVDSAFLTPPPPGGVGMQCSVLDQFSYGQVKATSKR